MVADSATPPAPGTPPEGPAAEAGAAAAAETAPAAKPPKQRGLIRWLTLLVLIGGPTVAAVVLKDDIAERVAVSVGQAALGGEMLVGSAEVDLLAGRVTLREITSRDPDHPEGEHFTAAEAVMHVSPLALLRGQLVVDEMRVTSPRGRIVRHPDGSIGVGEAPPEPEEPEPGIDLDEWRRRLEEIAKERDFLADLERVAEMIRERLERQEKEEEAERERIERGEPHPDGRAVYVRRKQPRLLIRRLVCDDVEIEIQDRSEGASPLKIVDGRLVVENLSSAPAHHPEPIGIDLTGSFAGAEGSQVQLAGALDLKPGSIESLLTLAGRQVPLHLLDPYLKGTVPIKLEEGMTGNVEMPFAFTGLRIDSKPVIELRDIATSLRDPAQSRIAGIEADRVIEALREVRNLRLDDMRIHGPLQRPKVEMGDTLRQVVVEGGRAYAQRKATEAAEDAAGRLRAAAADTEAGRSIMGAAEAALGGSGDDEERSATDEAKERASGALDRFRRGRSGD